MIFLENFSILFILLIGVLGGLFLVHIDEVETAEKIQIIEQTKEFAIYDNCEKLSDKFYCYNN